MITPLSPKQKTKVSRRQKSSIPNWSHHAYVAGDTFSMGDIPMGIRIYRFRNLISDRPPLPNMERWYAAIEKRPAYHEHVGSIPLT